MLKLLLTKCEMHGCLTGNGWHPFLSTFSHILHDLSNMSKKFIPALCDILMNIHVYDSLNDMSVLGKIALIRHVNSAQKKHFTPS